MAATASRSLRAVRSSLLNTVRLSFSKRDISSSSYIPRFLASSHLIRPSSDRLSQVRFRVNRAGSGYSPSSGSNFGDSPPTEMAPLFPGCDYEHWLIVMDKPGGDGATKDQIIDCYVETLAKVLGSREQALRKIYNVSCERYFGFGCEIDEETSNKLEGIPGVLFVLPDSYVDAEYQDYGAELFQDGRIVPRPPDRQRRINEITSASRDNRTRNNDRPRYQRRRENMR